MDRRRVSCLGEYVCFASVDTAHGAPVYRVLSGREMILDIILGFLVFCFGVCVGKLASDIRWVRFLRDYDENSSLLVRAYQDMLSGAVKQIQKLEKKIELGYDPEEDNG